MGYTTYFNGEFKTRKKMPDELVKEINDFANERHCMPNNINGHTGFPGFWCQWIAADNSTIKWDGGDKFYNYVEWLKYIVENFLKPNGIELEGEVVWEGEEYGDIGLIKADGYDIYVALGFVDYGSYNLT